MIRKFTAALALLLWAGAVQAADLDGKLSAVDLKAGTITLPVDGKDQQFPLAKDCKVYVKGSAGRQTAYNLAAGGTAALAPGQTVSVTTDFIDGQEEAILVKINSGALGKPVQAVKPKKTPAAKPDPAKPDPAKPGDKAGASDAADSLEVQGVVAGVDLRHQMIAVTGSDGKVQRYHILKTASFFLSTPAVGNKGRSREKLDAAPNGLADATVGSSVTLTFDDAKKKAVSMIKITVAAPGTPSKKKN